MDEIKNSDFGKMKERIVYALKFGYARNIKHLVRL